MLWKCTVDVYFCFWPQKHSNPLYFTVFSWNGILLLDLTVFLTMSAFTEVWFLSTKLNLTHALWCIIIDEDTQHYIKKINYNIKMICRHYYIIFMIQYLINLCTFFALPHLLLHLQISSKHPQTLISHAQFFFFLHSVINNHKLWNHFTSSIYYWPWFEPLRRRLCLCCEITKWIPPSGVWRIFVVCSAAQR